MTKQALIQTRCTKGRRRVEVSPELLMGLLQVEMEGEPVKGGQLRCIQDRIPDNAVSLRAYINHRGNVELLIESEEWQGVAEGDVIPVITPVYQIESESSNEN